MEMITKEIKKNIPIKWGLRLKFNIYFSVIVIVTIIIDTFFVKLNGNTIIYHAVHAVITIMVIIALVNILFSRLILNPLNILVKAMQDIEKGEMDQGRFIKSLESEEIRNDEIGWLIQRFFEMKIKFKNLIRMHKKDSATAVAYRMRKELNDPLADLSKNIKLLNETINSMDLKDSRDTVQKIIDDVTKNFISIKTFSDDINSMFLEKNDKSV